jgi:putative flavoprotein involved in K+ transport
MMIFEAAINAAVPVAAGVKVDGLWPGGGRGGSYLLTAGRRRFTAEQVVVATGGQRVPSVPSFAGQLDPGVRQLHSSDYRNPSQLLPGGVLVVGEPPGRRHRACGSSSPT